MLELDKRGTGLERERNRTLKEKISKRCS